MNVEDFLRSKLEDYSVYEAAQKEIEALDEMFKERYSGHGLYEYQKQFILILHTCKFGCLTKKCRRAGITTTYAAHIAYLARTKGNKMGNIFICTASGQMTKEIIDLTKSFCTPNKVIAQNEMSIIKKKVIYSTANSAATHLCGRVFDEAFIDEASFINNIKDLIDSIASIGNTKIIATSTPAFTGEEHKDDYTRLVDELISSPRPGWNTQTISWFEVPYFNKGLVWKKILVEPTIDNEGNIKYDKERWNALINDGWIPTSPAIEKLYGLLGEDKSKTELLN
jgi:hypothetical protein